MAYRCVRFLVFYFCDMSGSIDRSGVRNGFLKKTSYVRCVVTREHIISVQMTDERSLSETKMASGSPNSSIGR